MAPEILEGKPYSGVAADIFALGVILFGMVTASAPFQGVSAVGEGETVVQKDKLYELLMKDRAKFFGRYKTQNNLTFSKEFISLVSAMLHPDPNLRPTH